MECKYIPIISLSDVNQTKNDLEKLQKEISIFSKKSTSKISLEYQSKDSQGRALAIIIADNSMSPKFLLNDIVLVDFDRKPKPGDFVLVHITNTAENVIRKYKESEKNSRYELQALNSDWATMHVNSENKAAILGTVIEHRTYF